jgi:conjugative transposon TraN protein
MRIYALLISLFCFVSAHAQTDTLWLSTAYTTHVIFATDITYADLSNNRIVAAKVVEQNRNILAIKAKCPFEESTSVSALEANGTMHTYIVRFDLNPKTLIVNERELKETASRPLNGKNNVTSNRRTDAPTLSQMASASQMLHHIGAREYGITALCENIVSYSDIIYFVLSLQNKSGVSYDINDATFVIESKKKGKRTVVFEKTIFPEGRHGNLSAAAGETGRIAYSFSKMTLSDDQVLKIYCYEESGQRNLELTINCKDINKAERSL